ncbi:MAG TPA: hypothetical protein DDY32_20610 [Desulfobulbaceae bacterium]|nr:hypothetical protein [Desulfobulbaceae bacterium]
MISRITFTLRYILTILAVFSCLGLSAVSNSLAASPATSLDLVLMGVIDGRTQDRRAIILNKKDNTQHIYQVGDTVAGAQIKGIFWGKVVLSANGRDEVLDMSETTHYRTIAVAAPAPVATSVSPQEKIIASSDSGEIDSRLIPERVRLVLPDQEGTGAQNEVQNDE